MRRIFPIALIAGILFLNGALAADHEPPKSASQASWDAVKAAQVPKNEMPTLYGTSVRMPMATMAWEDGVYISRDGLTVYTDYFPADVFKALIDKSIPLKTFLYERGPSLGQDFSNPIHMPFRWIHSDIAYATRTSTTEPFSAWQLTNRKGATANSGGPQGILDEQDNTRFDYFVYTYDNTGSPKIMMLRDTDRALTGQGKLLPPNINNTDYDSDNPDIERYDPANLQKLVLFFDSVDRPGKGQHDIWYSLSDDGGDTWADPKGLSTIDTPSEEHQPHLFKEKGEWWLYFSAPNPADDKLAIYRTKQTQANNWDSWGKPELVVSAGATMGIGEPTLTANGDIAFVAITFNEQGTPTDQFDSDPWFLPRLVPQTK